MNRVDKFILWYGDERSREPPGLCGLVIIIGYLPVFVIPITFIASSFFVETMKAAGIAIVNGVFSLMITLGLASLETTVFKKYCEMKNLNYCEFIAKFTS